MKQNIIMNVSSENHWKEISLINIGLIINATEKNTCNYTYAVYVLYYLVHGVEIAWISYYG